MSRVTIVPTVPEYGIARADYEAFAAALREDGYDAGVKQPGGGVEQRSLPPELGQAAHDVAIFLGGALSQEAVSALVAIARERLRRKTKRTRQGVIYGPKGEVLRRFDIPADDDQ